MANLIPPTAKKQVRIEYWIRVASVWLFLFGTALLVAAAFNFPVHVLVKNQLAIYNERFDEADSQNTSFLKVEEDIIKANKIALLLSSDQETVSFVMLLQEFDVVSGDAIRISSFNFKRANKVLDTITISGVARDRESLVEFSNLIEANNLFEKAEIPLSNLAKDKDIPFTLNVVPKKEK